MTAARGACPRPQGRLPVRRRLPIPSSAAFDVLARGRRYRHRTAIAVRAAPDAIFEALHQVTVRDMKLAWLLGELRYLPSRLAGRRPPSSPDRPFLDTLVDGGSIVLREETPRELITGLAARLHRVDQAPRRFVDAASFEAFDHPDHEKLLISIRVAPTGRPGEQWLVLEHATRPLSRRADRRFAAYWLVIEPLGAFVSWLLLRAIRRRAERAAAHPAPWRPGAPARPTHA